MNTPKYKAVVTLTANGSLLGGTKRHESSKFDSREDAENWAYSVVKTNRECRGFAESDVQTTIVEILPKSQSGRSKASRAKKQLTPTEQFFYNNAGYSHDPKTETAEQGRIRCAQELAEAEAYAQRKVSLGEWSFEWSDDWSIGSHKEFYGDDSAYADREPETCESCTLLARAECGQMHEVLASLGCIDDADANYRRVIEAELASEAISR